MAQFVLKIEQLSHIIAARGSQDLRLPLLENAKKGCIILEFILVQGVCPLKVEIAPLPRGFRLKVSLSHSAYVHVYHNTSMRRSCRQESELCFARPFSLELLWVCYKTIDSCS